MRDVLGGDVDVDARSYGCLLAWLALLTFWGAVAIVVAILVH